MNSNKENFLSTLENIIIERKNSADSKSYTATLFAKGLDKILQKVGEESVEYIIAAKNDNDSLAIGEAADLLYHFIVSLHARNLTLDMINEELIQRHNSKIK